MASAVLPLGQDRRGDWRAMRQLNVALLLGCLLLPLALFLFKALSDRASVVSQAGRDAQDRTGI